jgi:hypothetical protein
MYTGSLAAVARGEDWIEGGSLIGEDNEERTLTDATFVMSICRQDCPSTAVLTASTENEKITLPSATTFQWWFDKDDTATLCAGTYDVFLYVIIDDIRTQIASCTVPVVEGGPAS